MREPSEYAAPRAYLPVSQPQASGLNAWNSMPCFVQSGSTSSSASRTSSDIVSPHAIGASRTASATKAASTFDTPIAPTTPSVRAPRAPIASRQAASPDPARGRGRRRCGRRRAGRDSRARRVARPGASPPSSPTCTGWKTLLVDGSPTGRRSRTQAPMARSLSPPPYDDAVSNLARRGPTPRPSTRTPPPRFRRAPRATGQSRCRRSCRSRARSIDAHRR